MDLSTHSHDDLVAFAFGIGMALVMCLRRCSLCVRYIFMLRSQCDLNPIIPLIFSFIKKKTITEASQPPLSQPNWRLSIYPRQPRPSNHHVWRTTHQRRYRDRQPSPRMFRPARRFLQHNFMLTTHRVLASCPPSTVCTSRNDPATPTLLAVKACPSRRPRGACSTTSSTS